MNIKQVSVAYSILKGTRKLRLMKKLNKHYSFRRILLIDREVNKLFKPTARNRGNY